LRDEFRPLLEAVLASPGSIVRESPARTVTFHRLGDRAYYIKRYWMGRSLWRRLLFLVRRPPGEAQWDAGLRLERLGVPVVRFLACGLRRSFRGLEESILITEGFDGVSLAEDSVSDWSTVLRFVQAMHDRGVIQPDLHVGNLLISPESGELRLVDAGHVRFQRAVSPAERRENLAFLRLSVPIPLPNDIERLSLRLRSGVLSRRSRRCLKHNREFAPHRFGELTWQVRSPFLTESLRRIAEDPDRFLEGEARLLKAGRTTTVGCRDGLVLKRFNFVKPASLLKDLLRGSRAKRSYRLAYHLELLGIPTPRPLAFGDRKRAGFPVGSYCVTEEIPDARTLANVLETDQAIDRALVRNLADLVAGLHSEGFSHRDLKTTNFLVGSAGKVLLLDLDGLRFRGRISEAVTGANLARLARAVLGAARVGRAERLVFLLRYYRKRGLRRVPACHR
jgi:tRNA A-37 threonylcarbamoyl transferase component Bud32